MPDSRGAIFVSVLIAAMVALAIIFPQTRDQTGPIVTELRTAGGADSFTDQQKDEIRDTIRAYLIANPTVIVEAIEALQNRQQQHSRGQPSSDALSTNMDRLVNSSGDPSIGNPNATVTVVEFFDY